MMRFAPRLGQFHKIIEKKKEIQDYISKYLPAISSWTRV